jgi:hypothetical protein
MYSGQAFLFYLGLLDYRYLGCRCLGFKVNIHLITRMQLYIGSGLFYFQLQRSCLFVENSCYIDFGGVKLFPFELEFPSSPPLNNYTNGDKKSHLPYIKISRAVKIRVIPLSYQEDTPMELNTFWSIKKLARSIFANCSGLL